MKSKEDPPGKETYQEDIARVVRWLISRVVRTFPCLESLDAVRVFTESVSDVLIKTVIAERVQLAKRVGDPDRLNNPLLRAMRSVRDYHLRDIRDHTDDPIAARTPRWIEEMRTLPVYKGKLDAPHPALLAVEYDLLHRLCVYIEREIGFDRWGELAQELPQEASIPLSLPLPLWPKGEYREIYIPDNAMPEEAALRILSDKTNLSRERLRKLIQQGRRAFSPATLTAIERAWRKASIDPKLNIVRASSEDDEETLKAAAIENYLSECAEHEDGVTVKDVFEGLFNVPNPPA